MLRPLLRAYALVFLVAGLLFVFAERLVLAWIGAAAALAGAPALALAGPSLWLGLAGSLMAVIALLAFRLARAPGRAEAWDALLLSKAVSSGLFVFFAARTRNPVFLGAAAVDGGILAHLYSLRVLFERSRDPLAPRSGPPAYEAWFARASDPATGRALWVRRARLEGERGAESLVWAVFFEPSAGRVVVRRWSEAPGSWTLTADGLEGAGPGVSWKFSWTRLPCPSFDVVPAWLRGLSFSRGYASAAPAARFSGRAALDGTEWTFARGLGSVGHVWGEGLGRGWWWAHAVLDAAGGEPVVVEVLSAPAFLGRRATSVWFWRGGRLRAAAGPLRLLLNSSRRDGDVWSFSARAGGLLIEGTCRPGPRAELEYADASGRRLVCRNSKTSELTLRLSGGGASEELSTKTAAVEYAEPA